ncbi:TPA: hypothetical protein ACWWR6_000720 [Enterococcus faecium]|nr:hypothetical protein [Enterococcus faecium]MCU2010710.1 hypothetical protein [Enterococcus faecium]
MEKREQMIAALKKVMNSLVEVFMAFAHICEEGLRTDGGAS